MKEATDGTKGVGKRCATRYYCGASDLLQPTGVEWSGVSTPGKFSTQHLYWHGVTTLGQENRRDLGHGYGADSTHVALLSSRQRKINTDTRTVTS